MPASVASTPIAPHTAARRHSTPPPEAIAPAARHDTAPELPLSALTATPATPATAAAKPENNTNADEAASLACAASLWPPLEEALAYLGDNERRRVQSALQFAAGAHARQKRDSGEPYITHPVAVAQQCASFRLDADALCAALLHDTVEDTGVHLAELQMQFGAKVAELVDGLTKLDKLKFASRKQTQAESFRKMLLAMARDLRVIIIKLADRLHNTRTLQALPSTKQTRQARETLEVYAPIASRLGLASISHELQDLCFGVLHPMRARVISRALAAAGKLRLELIKRVNAEVREALARAGMEVDISSREKSLYSIYRKMRDKRLSFAEVSDLYGFRLIVAEPLQCYTALGVLHGLYRPIPGRLKDYIATPKDNGYQSLHTTLTGPSMLPLEFQIRTPDMDTVAERGVAAHWLYKAQHPDEAALPGSVSWLRSVLDIQQSTSSAEEFLEHIKFDLEPQAVYVLTPQGEVVSLPRGATAVDFAYAVHSNIGHRTVAVKINQELAPLRSELHNGDQVEIVTSGVTLPNPEWLSFVKTGRARAAIRHHLRVSRQADAVMLGERLLRRAVRHEGLDETLLGESLWREVAQWAGAKGMEELAADVGMGLRSASLIAKRLAARVKPQGLFLQASARLFEPMGAESAEGEESVELNGKEGLPVQYAKCCQPVPGDEAVGYVGQGEGLIVHRSGCAQLKRLVRQGADHFLSLTWAQELDRLFATTVDIKHENQRGILARIASCISQQDIDIANIDMQETPQAQTTVTRYHLLVRDRRQLDHLLALLPRLAQVIAAQRVNEPQRRNHTQSHHQ